MNEEVFMVFQRTKNNGQDNGNMYERTFLRLTTMLPIAIVGITII